MTSAPSNSTRRSPPSRWPACAGWAGPGDREQRRRRHRPRPPARFLRLPDRHHPARPDGARGRASSASPPCASASARAPRCCWSACDGGPGQRERHVERPGGFSTLLVEEREDRVVVPLNRPEVRNAIDQPMVDELHPVCAAAGAEPEDPDHRRRPDGRLRLRRGHRPAARTPPRRCAGGHQLHASSSGSPSCPCRSSPPWTASAWAAAPSWPTPPTSASARPACGSATPRPAWASWPRPAPAGGSRSWWGSRVAKEILLAGRVLRAERGAAVGLITEIHEAAELMDAAHALADRIGRQDPLAVRITKSVFHAPAEAHPADRPPGPGHALRIPGQVRPHAGVPRQEASQEGRQEADTTSTGRSRHEQLRTPGEPSRHTFPTTSASSAAAAWAPASPTPS